MLKTLKISLHKTLCAPIFCVIFATLSLAKDNNTSYHKSQTDTLLVFEHKTKHLSPKNQSLKANKKQSVKIPTH